MEGDFDSFLNVLEDLWTVTRQYGTGGGIEKKKTKKEGRTTSIASSSNEKSSGKKRELISDGIEAIITRLAPGWLL